MGHVGQRAAWIPAALDDSGDAQWAYSRSEETATSDEEFPHYFHVIETSDKVTLFNHQFAVWIVPKIIDGNPTTLTLISLITEDEPNLEIVFSTSGLYNAPKYVLKVLKSYLSEVLDTEAVISSIGKHN